MSDHKEGKSRGGKWKLVAVAVGVLVVGVVSFLIFSGKFPGLSNNSSQSGIDSAQSAPASGGNTSGSANELTPGANSQTGTTGESDGSSTDLPSLPDDDAKALANGDNVTPEEGKVTLVANVPERALIVWVVGDLVYNTLPTVDNWSKVVEPLQGEEVSISVGGNFDETNPDQSGFCQIFNGVDMVSEESFSGAEGEATCTFVVQ